MVKLSNHILTKLCLIGFLISFTLIYHIEQNYVPKLMKIENISYRHLNKHLLIKAEVISQRQSKNTLFLKVKDNTEFIDAILFKTNLTLDINRDYFFEGKVGYYKDSHQLIIKNVYG